jgi:hypothetical protein
VTEGVVHAYNKSERVNEGEPPEESGIVILVS